MIVDIHTHIFRPDIDFGLDLKADLKRCGVEPSDWGNVSERHLETTKAADVAVVFGLQAKQSGWQIPNELVAQHVAKASKRLLFFTSIDPSQPLFMEELEKCHQDWGAVGVKMAPLYQNVHPTDERCYKIYRYCSDHGLPILFHVGTSFVSGTYLEYSRPIHYDTIAVDFPNLSIVMAHLGHPWEGETISVIRRHANVYADVSALYYRPWQFYNSMQLVVEYKAQSKILFGSDFPFTTTSDSLKGVRSINGILSNSGLPPIPMQVLEEIINRNSLELLNLPNPLTR